MPRGTMIRKPTGVGSGWTGVNRRTPDLRPTCSSVPISERREPESPRRRSTGFTTELTKAVPIRGLRRHILAAATAATPITAGKANKVTILRMLCLLTRPGDGHRSTDYASQPGRAVVDYAT